MPVLESTDHLTPRSALHHRPIGDDAAKQEPIVSVGATPVAQRASRLRPKQTDGEDEMKEWQRTDAGTTRQDHTTATPRHTGKAAKKLPKLPRKPAVAGKGKFWRRAHPLFYLGVGMIAMLALWTVLSMVVSWGSTTLNDLRYGRPRTFQVDAFVGHNETGGTPSHFIAINLHGHIEVIEFPGGDGSKARIYLGPQLYGSGDDLIPVTLSFVNVEDNHQPDMIIRFQDSRLVFVNAQGGFRPATPAEWQTVEHYLKRHGQ